MDEFALAYTLITGRLDKTLKAKFVNIGSVTVYVLQDCVVWLQCLPGYNKCLVAVCAKVCVWHRCFPGYSACLATICI